MEEFKDTIVSHPPAMYNQSSGTANITLENYKGILLCDRPVLTSCGTGGDGAGSVAGDGGARTFVPANKTGNPLGAGPSVEMRAQRERHQLMRAENMRNHRDKSRQVLSRHRRWLRSFAEQMRRMKQDEIECTVEATRRAARLRAAAEQHHAAARQAGVGMIANDVPSVNETHASTFPPPPTPPEQTVAPAQEKPNSRSTAAKKTSRKPKWAMTEDEAFEDELKMNDELLDFAKNLDYDKFISDFEVAEALEVMRDRVQQIAQENHWTDKDIRRAASREEDDDLQSTIAASEMQEGRAGDAARCGRQGGVTADGHREQVSAGGAVVHERGWDGSVTASRGSVLRRAISRDALTLAERMLAASPSLQKVYTRQTLARMLQRAALTGETDVSAASLLAQRETREETLAKMSAAELAEATAIGPAEAAVEPRVVIVKADAMPLDFDGSASQQPGRILRELQMSKERTQGLPYLYRCPAI